MPDRRMGPAADANVSTPNIGRMRCDRSVVLLVQDVQGRRLAEAVAEFRAIDPSGTEVRILVGYDALTPSR
jgi:hypothetical protein